MSIYASVYPKNKFPEKFQIEQMYCVAYRIDPGIFQPEDVDRFGLNLKILESEYEVEMKAPLDWLRKHVGGLWGRMTKAQKAGFLMSYLNSAIPYVQDILEDLTQVLGKELPIQKLTDLHVEIATSVAQSTKDEIYQMMKRRSKK